MTTDPIVAEIKSKIDILVLIQNYLTVKRAGANYKAICPFHEERTPSFMISPERQTWRCFGCNEGGDAFSFIMKIENIDFPAALELLARQAGVALPERTKRPADRSGGTQSGSPAIEKTDLYAVNNTAATFFAKVLTTHPAGKPALDYLTSRTLSPEIMKQFMIGYAPAKTDVLSKTLNQRGYTGAMVTRAGRPDRFFDRVMFPLFDVIGNVVGFTGRAMGDAMPKYLNTADTDLFHKNRYIYGLYQAKQAIRDTGQIILVEGQFDLILSHQAGVRQTVATSGTALTDDHLRILRRYADTLVIAFDGDNAGRKAAERAIGMALGHGFELGVVSIDNGSDPGDVVARDPAAWREAVSRPDNPIDWLLEYYFPDAKSRTSAAERKAIYDALFPHILRQADAVSRSYLLQRLAMRLKLSSDTPLREALAEWQKQPMPSSAKRSAFTATAPPPVAPSLKPFDPERRLVGIIYVRPPLLTDLPELAKADFTNVALFGLYESAKIWYSKSQRGPEASSRDLIAAIRPELDFRAAAALDHLLDETEASLANVAEAEIATEARAMADRIRDRVRDAQKQDFAQRIAAAEAAHDRAQVKALMLEMQAALKY